MRGARGHLGRAARAADSGRCCLPSKPSLAAARTGSRMMTSLCPWHGGRGARTARVPGVSSPTVASPLPRPLPRCGRGR